jgi:S-disulfanyl-L-cysteine oxidoreductase SoxD
MSSCRRRLDRALPALALARACLGVSLCAAVAASAQTAYPSVGRAATPREVQAWDIDVRPDFKGLPKGSGSVAQGQDVWESKCASCHGVFGEANEVFSPLVGGTTKEDVKTGHVARLNDPSFPGRTTLMKLPTLSTLWDYINRAMPWTAPKSLATDEVYAVTAYLLNMGGILPDTFVLSDATMAQAQRLLPNRKGFTTDHGLWPGKGMGNGGKPDVKVAACMQNCATEAQVSSFLPDFARNNHGNLAEQQRLVGPQRGADTTRPAAANPQAAAAAAAAAAAVAMTARATTDNPAATALALAQKNNCMVCHNLETKMIGPGFREVAARHGARADAEAYLAGKIKSGGQGLWGATPMPAQTLTDGDARLIAQWLAAGATK